MITVTLINKKNKKRGWEYLKTQAEIFQLGIFWVGIFGEWGGWGGGGVGRGEGECGGLYVIHQAEFDWWEFSRWEFS